ncbi:MAG TPA: hypothetical protein VIM14_14345, partial [Polyangia bacterium]
MDAEAPPVDPRASSPNEGNERATPASPGVVLAATFTADPLCESLSLLLREAGLASSVEVSPYGQLFQQLLDPSSGFALNRRGVNVVLVRLEDWWRGANGRVDLLAADRSVVERNTTDLAQALRTAAAAGATPAVLCICPPSAAIAADDATRAFLDAVAGRLQAAVADTSGIRVLPMQWAATW